MVNKDTQGWYKDFCLYKGRCSLPTLSSTMAVCNEGTEFSIPPFPLAMGSWQVRQTKTSTLCPVGERAQCQGMEDRYFGSKPFFTFLFYFLFTYFKNHFRPEVYLNPQKHFIFSESRHPTERIVDSSNSLYYTILEQQFIKHNFSVNNTLKLIFGHINAINYPIV